MNISKRFEIVIENGVYIFRMTGRAIEFSVSDVRIWGIYTDKCRRVSEKMAASLTARQVVKKSLRDFPDMTYEEFRCAKSFMTGVVQSIVEHFARA